MARLLPSLAQLNVAAIGAGCDDDDDDDAELSTGWDAEVQKLKAEVAALPEARGEPVYFVAAKAGFTPQKKLSNLFGPTEWIYHARSKFRPLTNAYNWLLEQAEKAKRRTPETDAQFMRLINTVNPKSAKQRAAALEKGMDPNAYWQTPDGEPACGLVAKMLTGFASVARVNADGKGDWNVGGRGEAQKRRRLLMFLKLVGEAELADKIHKAKGTAATALINGWTSENMVPENTALKVAALRQGILEKYTAHPHNPYTNLLLSFGTRPLHEERNARKDKKTEPPEQWPFDPWVYSENPDAQPRCGDVVGMLLQLRRAAVRAEIDALATDPESCAEEAEQLRADESDER